MKKIITFAIATALAGMAYAIPNDTYATAEKLDGKLSRGSTTPVSNRDATSPADDPLCAEKDESNASKYGSTVWYKWTAPYNGCVQFDTKGSYAIGGDESPLDTVMCICQLNEDGVPYFINAFNDDAYTAKTSFIELQEVYAGETYYIGIGTKRIDTPVAALYENGMIQLNWLFVRELARIRFNPQGGTATTTSIRFLETDSRLSQRGEFPEPVRGGYDFLGWFTAPEGGVKVEGGDGYSKIKDYISEGYLELYAHWKVTGYATPQLQAFDKAQTFTGAFLTTSYGVVGSVEIKVAKKSAKNTSRLTIRVTRYETGKKVSAKGTLTIKDDGSAESDAIAIAFKDSKLKDDTMRMTVKPDGTFEMKGSQYLVEAAQVGGAITSIDHFTFSIAGLEDGAPQSWQPAVPAGFHVIREALPTNFTVSIVSQGTKFQLPKGTALKYATQKTSSIRPTRVPASTVTRPLRLYELTGLDDSNANKSMLKLTYQYKTGIFKGQFSLYATDGDNVAIKKPTLKKYTVKVCGIVMSRRGFGMSTLKDTNQEWVTLLVYP